MARFEFDGGRWCELRPPSANALIFIWSETEDDVEGPAAVARLQGYIKHFNNALVNCSWDGDMGDLPYIELTKLVRSWLRAGEDDALPPVPEPPTPDPSSDPDSAARTAGRRKSRAQVSSSPST